MLMTEYILLSVGSSGGSCGKGNKYSGSIKEQLGVFRLLNMNLAQWT